MAAALAAGVVGPVGVDAVGAGVAGFGFEHLGEGAAAGAVVGTGWGWFAALDARVLDHGCLIWASHAAMWVWMGHRFCPVGW